jgi:hypothetical protein
MKRRIWLQSVPPIGDRLFTRETAGVLRLGTRTVREYLQSGEIKGELSADAGDSGVQTLTLSCKARRSWDFTGKSNHGN